MRVIRIVLEHMNATRCLKIPSWKCPGRGSRDSFAAIALFFDFILKSASYNLLLTDLPKPTRRKVILVRQPSPYLHQFPLPAYENRCCPGYENSVPLCKASCWESRRGRAAISCRPSPASSFDDSKVSRWHLGHPTGHRATNRKAEKETNYPKHSNSIPSVDLFQTFEKSNFKLSPFGKR